ncbi:MAG: hypothetical protein ACJ72G_07535 [Friedmanniella sp.]
MTAFPQAKPLVVPPGARASVLAVGMGELRPGAVLQELPDA